MEDRARVIDLQRTFVPPRELTRSRPRDVRLTAGGKALYGLAIGLFAAALVVGTVLFLAASRQAEERRVFDRDSVVAAGEVIRLWRGSGDPKPAWVAYRFLAPDGEYEGQSRVRLSRWRALETGSPIAIRYLSTDPQRNMVDGADRRGIPPWVALIVAMAFGAGGAACLIGLNSQRRLLVEGRAAPALVNAVVKHKTSHGVSQQAIKYTFPLLSGAVAKGSCEAPRKPPAAGSVICVVYDTDRPSRSRPYPFPLVRL